MQCPHLKERWSELVCAKVVSFAFWRVSFILVSITPGCECVQMNAQHIGTCLFFVTYKHELP